MKYSVAQRNQGVRTTGRAGLGKLARVAAAGALGVAAMTTLAPAANAQTEKQIQAGCDEAGGDYDTYQDDLGNTVSWCCYRDSEGKAHCDMFKNGLYIRTEDTRKIPPVNGPVKPPANNAPIGTPPPAAPAN